MVGFTGIDQVYLYQSPVDMRRGAKSLGSIVCETMPAEGRRRAAFLFFGKSRSVMKAIVFDERGSWVLERRLEGCLFTLPEGGSESLLARPGTLQAIVEALASETRRERPR